MWSKIRIVDNVACGGFTSAEITGEEMIQQAGRELMDLVEAAAETKKP